MIEMTFGIYIGFAIWIFFISLPLYITINFIRSNDASFIPFAIITAIIILTGVYMLGVSK